MAIGMVLDVLKGGNCPIMGQSNLWFPRLQVAKLNMAMEIVGLPIKNADFPEQTVYQRV